MTISITKDKDDVIWKMLC